MSHATGPTRAQLRAAKFQSTVDIGDRNAPFTGTSTAKDDFQRHHGARRPAAFAPPKADAANASAPLVRDLPKNVVDNQRLEAFRETRVESMQRRRAPASEADWGTGRRYDAGLCSSNYTTSFNGAQSSTQLPPLNQSRSRHHAPINPITGEKRTVAPPPFEHPMSGEPRRSVNARALAQQRAL
jgi:hypothetical protein